MIFAIAIYLIPYLFPSCAAAQYPIHSLLVFDSNNSAIPIAWIITPRFASRESHRWLRSLYDRVHSKDPNWKLGGFIIDDPLADVHTIRFATGQSFIFGFPRLVAPS